MTEYLVTGGDVLAFRRKAGRNHQHRHILGIGLRHAGEGILDPRPMLGGEDAVLLAGANAAEAVRHAHAHALLPAEDGTDVELGAGIDQRIARIAGEKLGPLALEDLCDDVGTFHLQSNSVCGHGKSAAGGHAGGRSRPRLGIYSAATGVASRTLRSTASATAAPLGSSTRAERTR
jgi:hypothetical protein